ncbi:hypothetical protein [Sphingobium xenophagum]|uniref:hypothetical protein n=1 Tax=Sphingobium xenophagum TaxID=121428 RepID=UPI0002EA4D77|nr:hypothetical protein [Sphingobium xenophagum]
MAWKPDGTWAVEDDSVAGRVAALTAQDSALMQGARTSGLKVANRRGLMNSSMAAGASETAAIGAATPIASQDASQIYGKNIQKMQGDQQDKTTAATIAQADRANLAQTTASLADSYSNSVANTLTNDKIPAATRTAAQQNAANVYQQSIARLQSLYGVSLGW